MAFSEMDSSHVQAVLGCLLRDVASGLSEWLELQKALGAECVPPDDPGYGVPAVVVRAQSSSLEAVQPPSASVRSVSVSPSPAKPCVGGALLGCLASFNALRGSEQQAVPETREEKAAALEQLRIRASGCRMCRLGGVRRDIVWGSGPCDASIVFVAAGGNPNELEKGRIMPGDAGVLLDRIIAAMSKLHPEAAPERIYMTNVIKCASLPAKPEMREIAKCCLNILREEIRIISPKVVVVWGPLAYQAMFGGAAQVSQVRGMVQKFENIPAVVTHHPLEILRNENLKGRTWADVKLAVEQLPPRIS